MLNFKLELAFSFEIRLEKPIDLGLQADGYRLMIRWKPAEAHGPLFHGKLSDLGGDWVLLRQDGFLEIDVRAMLECADGRQVFLSYSGLGKVGKEVVDELLQTRKPGEPLSLPQVVIPLRSGGSCRTTVEPTTKDDALPMLNFVQLLGIGEADLTIPSDLRVRYDFYALSW